MFPLFGACIRTLFAGFILLATVHPALAQPAESSSGGRPDMSNYILKPRDVIRIEVFQEEDLTREVRVAAEGTISLPLINEVRVAGMTVQDAQETIRRLYDEKYLVDPQVSILVISYTERRLQVHGHVARPGPVLIPPEENMTLTEAIAAANGLTRMADKRKIIIRRPGPNGRDRVIEVDFDEILTNPNADDILVYDGDNILVQERVF